MSPDNTCTYRRIYLNIIERKGGEKKLLIFALGSYILGKRNNFGAQRNGRSESNIKQRGYRTSQTCTSI